MSTVLTDGEHPRIIYVQVVKSSTGDDLLKLIPTKASDQYFKLPRSKTVT